MKNYKNIPGNLLTMICAAGLLCMFLSSCLKSSPSDNYNPPVALLTFIQASPDEPTMDFYLNTDRINLNPINYGDDFDYFKVYVGKRTLNFYAQGTMTTIFSDTATFNQNMAYSLFLTGKATKPEKVLLTDSISRPADGKANIRFINLSPDAPAVSLAVTGTGGQVLATNVPYKGHTSFAPLTGNTYSLEVRQGTTNTVLATLPGVTFNNGFVYTVWFHGLVNSTSNNDKLAIGVITNAYYY